MASHRGMRSYVVRSLLPLILCAFGCTFSLPSVVARAQEEPARDSSPASPETEAEASEAAAVETSVEAELALKQSHLADKYARLEKLLFDLAALEAAENPARAALLRRAYQQSAEQLIKKQMDSVSDILAKNDLKRAVGEQEEVSKDLKALLELLLSEDRPERLKSDQERLQRYIREIETLLRKQLDVRGRTEGGGEPQKLAGEQGKISDRTQKLSDQIREDEGQKSDANQTESDRDEGAEQKPNESTPNESTEEQQPAPADQKPRDSQNSDGQSGENKPMKDGSSESQPGEQKPDEQKPDEQKTDEQKPNEPQPGEQKPMEGEPMPGQPSDQQQQQQQQPGQPSEQQPSDMPPADGDQQQQQQQQQGDEHPALKRLAEAFQRMREAEQRLEEAKRQEAIEEQQKAEAELQKLKAELEQILRQLREEEVGRMLELLESRFRKMLDLELRVYESTKRLDRIAEADRGRDFAIQANNVSADQRKIAIEADKALVLLEEEGSSVSFPEAVEQLRDEMNLVAERLAALKTGFVTQESEEAIIAELEELIAALQKAQQDLDQKRQQQQQQQQPSEPGEMPLVDKLAELKMIRSLQMRVNTRTQRFARLLADLEDPVGQVTDGELREHIQQLAGREQRIYDLTRDLILGKNK